METQTAPEAPRVAQNPASATLAVIGQDATAALAPSPPPPPPPTWRQDGRPLHDPSCPLWSLAPVDTGQLFGQAAAAGQQSRPLRRDVSMSVEVHPPLPQVCCPPPPPYTLPSTSEVSTTFSAAPLIARSSRSRPRKPAASVCRARRCGVLVVHQMRRVLNRGGVVVLYAVTWLMLTAGSVLLSLGTMATLDERKLSILMQIDSYATRPLNTLGLLKSVAVGLMAAGGVLFFLGFLGCCGMLVRSRVMVGAFGFLMALLLLSQLHATALVLFNGDKVGCRLKHALVGAVKQSYEGTLHSPSAVSQALDFTQLSLGCCGVDSAWDFRDTPWFSSRCPQNLTLPWTCCRLQQGEVREGVGRRKDLHAWSLHPFPLHPHPPGSVLMKENCPFMEPGPDNPHTDRPCFQAVTDTLRQHCALLVSGMVLLTALQLAAMVTALVLASGMGKKTATTSTTPT